MKLTPNTILGVDTTTKPSAKLVKIMESGLHGKNSFQDHQWLTFHTHLRLDIIKTGRGCPVQEWTCADTTVVVPKVEKEMRKRINEKLSKSWTLTKEEISNNIAMTLKT